jgi:hypothetical protein
MNGIDAYGYVQQVAGRLAELQQRSQIEPVLDELEYLYEVMDPELQDAADQLIAVLRERLERA